MMLRRPWLLPCWLLLAVAWRSPAEEPPQPPETPRASKKPQEYPLWDGKEKVAEYAKRAGLEPALTLELEEKIKLEVLLVPAGKFLMGSLKSEQGREYDELQHEVTLTRPFYMGKYEVTQEQYKPMVGHNPAVGLAKGLKRPVPNVSWEEAMLFCLKAGQKLHREVRLPTEAEWEWACRAGTTTRYYTGDTEEDLDRAGWYRGNCAPGSQRDGTQVVGQKEPNAFGLYDMHGNVWEWCMDTYDAEYPAGPLTDPKGPSQGLGRVVRGGCWLKEAEGARSANREWYRAVDRSGIIGFRVAVPVPPRR